MRKNEKDIKKNFPKERPVIRSNRKVLKPWIMQYKWFSVEFAKKNSFSRNPSLDWITHYDKYKDLEHALQMLNKELRSYVWVRQKWNDRANRLYNKNTGEILSLVVQDNKVIIQHE
jgi:hypothetical protein